MCGNDLHDDIGENLNPVSSGTYSTIAFTERAVEIIRDHDQTQVNLRMQNAWNWNGDDWSETSRIGQSINSMWPDKKFSFQPLMLYLSYTAPHTPLIAPQEYLDLYPNITNTQTKNYAGTLSLKDSRFFCWTEKRSTVFLMTSRISVNQQTKTFSNDDLRWWRNCKRNWGAGRGRNVEQHNLHLLLRYSGPAWSGRIGLKTQTTKLACCLSSWEFNDLHHGQIASCPAFLYTGACCQSSLKSILQNYRSEDALKECEKALERCFLRFLSLTNLICAHCCSLCQTVLRFRFYLLSLKDNGGTGNAGSNDPLRGNKGDYFEGGIRMVGFVNSPLLRTTGVEYNGLVHVSDWFPSLLNLAGGDVADLALDGFDVWESMRRVPFPVPFPMSDYNEVFYEITTHPIAHREASSFGPKVWSLRNCLK